MNKPFLIVQITDGDLGQIKQRDTYEEAIDIAAKMAAEQCDIPEADIRQEMATAADPIFYDPNGGWSIQLAQVDDD